MTMHKFGYTEEMLHTRIIQKMKDKHQSHGKLFLIRDKKVESRNLQTRRQIQN